MDLEDVLAPMRLGIDRLDERFDLLDARLDQYHGETRELVATMFAAQREHSLAIRDLATTLREIREDIRENREQTRTNTQAVLRLLDRFGDGPLPAS